MLYKNCINMLLERCKHSLSYAWNISSKSALQIGLTKYKSKINVSPSDLSMTFFEKKRKLFTRFGELITTVNKNRQALL